MKKFVKLSISLLLLLAMLLSVACVPSGSGNEDDPNPEFTDLSAENSPKYTDDETYDLTVNTTALSGVEADPDVDPRTLCAVKAIIAPSTSVGDALAKVAHAISKNFADAGISATIELHCVEYFQNSSVKNGAISYRAKIYLENGETVSVKMNTADIKKLEGEWLEHSDGYYGAKRDSLGQWKTAFDRSGIIYLENNVIEFAEGVRTVEYAVIGENTEVTDNTVEWHAPQLLVMNEGGFDSLYINAALDYGKTLVKGEKYRFVVRGVSENDNYVLHLDIPFTYSPISDKATTALDAAKQAIAGINLTCSPDTADKEEYIISELASLIGNESIAVSLVCTADGMLSDTFEVKLSYSPEISSKRYPAYTLGGTARSDFFNYTGDAFSVSLNVKYADQASSIKLVAPFDGESGLCIASDAVAKHSSTDSDILSTNIFEYTKGEECLPKPVRLEWTDSAGNGSYTVTVSEHEDLSSPITVTTTETFAEVYNLKVGQRYYWQVKRDGESSAIFAFTTESGYPRFIRTENVSNFRDVGGHVTLDGKTVKQGLLYRSANLDSTNPADIEIITKLLGIKSELDLRGAGEGKTAPLGDSVQYIKISITYYAQIFNEDSKEAMRQAVSFLADENNYPVVYHCAIGRDRTGTLTVIVLGLLGVDEDTLLKEYLASLNSRLGNNDGASADAIENNFKSLISGFKAHGDRNASLQENIESYLLGIGVTAEEIASIRRIMLED